MRHRFHKLFYIWQLEKEEAWINEMAQHGYGLVGMGRMTFDFEDIEPGKYTYKNLFLKGTVKSEKNRPFLEFLEEMGIEMVSELRYPGHTCIYVRSEGGFDVFSDLDSKIEYEKIQVRYIFAVFILNLFAALFNLACAVQLGTFANGICCGISGVLAVFLVVNAVKKANKIKKLKAERSIHE